MSFTADELQSFNDILDRKLALHRQEIERTLEQRLQFLRREIEQRLLATQQEMTRSLKACKLYYIKNLMISKSPSRNLSVRRFDSDSSNNNPNSKV